MTSTLMPDHYRLEARFDDDGDTVTHYHCITSGNSVVFHDLDRWSHQREVGRGASCTVSLQQNANGHLRAVKRMLEPNSHSRELNALRRVATTNSDLFVKFLGYYQDRNFLYIAMEYIQYGDLSAYIRAQKEPITEPTSRDITRQVLEALTILHKEEICHRDLKPQNILIAVPDPIKVKVADFGSSKILKDTRFLTRVGTDGYFAPELLGLWSLPSPQDCFTYAVDIWSLGCILYELLAGAGPFTSTENAETEISGLICTTKAPSRSDMKLFMLFCSHHTPLPVKRLEDCGVSKDTIRFLQVLLRADPSRRPSAHDALKSMWNITSPPSPPRGSPAWSSFSKISPSTGELFDFELMDYSPSPLTGSPAWSLSPYELLDYSPSPLTGSPAWSLSSFAHLDYQPSPPTGPPATSPPSKRPLSTRRPFYCKFSGCPTADKQYRSLSELKDHEGSHGPARFQCPECKEMFKQERILKKHCLRVHSEWYMFMISKPHYLNSKALG